MLHKSEHQRDQVLEWTQFSGSYTTTGQYAQYKIILYGVPNWIKVWSPSTTYHVFVGLGVQWGTVA